MSGAIAGRAGSGARIGAIAAVALVLASVPAPAAIEGRSGVIVVSGKVALGADVPANDTLSASVGLGETVTGTRTQQGANIVATITRSGNTATFTARIPYRFLLNSETLSQVELNVIAGVSGSTADTSTGMQIPLPAQGATTNVSFSMAM